MIAVATQQPSDTFSTTAITRAALVIMIYGKYLLCFSAAAETSFRFAADITLAVLLLELFFIPVQSFVVSPNQPVVSRISLVLISTAIFLNVGPVVFLPLQRLLRVAHLTVGMPAPV
jgi:hypothetical protein